ncbi:MAG TPA: pitrilysin family protein [Pyrinomonadaceae bacterium]
MKRNLSALALLLSLILSSFAPAVRAQTRGSAATPSSSSSPSPSAAAATARAPQATPWINRQLANGLEVVVLEDHSVPLVTVEMAVKNGSFTEPPELNGLSHLFEHMFFKSNRATANAEDYLANIGKLGVAYNGSTREEIVNYYFTTTTPNYPVAMRLMRDSIRFPLFEEREFQREQQVVIGELDRNESNPYFYLNQELMNRLFYKFPSRKQPGGNRETVSKATTDIMRMIQKRYYVPNNSALIITGDVQPDEIFRQAQELFGDWPRAEDPFVKFPLVDHPSLAKNEGLVLTQPVQNAIIAIGWHGPSIGKDNEATYAADVFSFILRQPNSRFQRALVDTGLVNAVDISYYTQRNVGPIMLTAQTTPDKARAAIRAIYNEVAHFNDKDYFTDEQLENAKALLEADDLFSREKLSDYSHTLGFWWASTGLDYFRGYLGNLRRTSRADINRYVSNYVLGKPRVSIVMMSDEAQRSVQLKSEEVIGQ